LPAIALALGLLADEVQALQELHEARDVAGVVVAVGVEAADVEVDGDGDAGAVGGHGDLDLRRRPLPELSSISGRYCCSFLSSLEPVREAYMTPIARCTRGSCSWRAGGSCGRSAPRGSPCWAFGEWNSEFSSSGF
jgi:hypothetical protein